MRQQKIKTSDQIVKHQHFTLLELLDRLLDKGVMVKGELLLSVADIDLVYLNLGLLLSSVKTVEKAARRGGNAELEPVAELEPMEEASACSASTAIHASRGRNGATGETVARTLPSAIDHGLGRFLEPK